MIIDVLRYANLGQINDLIDIIPASIYFKKRDGVYLNGNQTLLDDVLKFGFISGDLTTKDILGKTDFDLFSESIAGEYRSSDIETMRLRRGICVEENVRLKNGDILSQITTKRPIFDVNNEVIGIVGATTLIPLEKNQSLKNELSEKLSAREKDCLHLYLQGKTSKESAIILGISYRTVEWHIVNIKTKLNCSNKRDLFCYRNII